VFRSDSSPLWNAGGVDKLVRIEELPSFTEICGTLKETLLNDEWLQLFMDTCTLKISREFIVDCRGLDALRPPVDIVILWTGEKPGQVRWRRLNPFIQNRDE